MSRHQVSIRELAHNASRVVRDVAETRQVKLITKHGRPIAAIVPFDDRQLAQLLQNAMPDLTEELDQALSERGNGIRVDMDEAIE